MPKQRRDIPWLDTRHEGGSYYAFWNDPGERQPKSRSLRTTDAVEAHIRFAAFLSEGRAIFEPERQNGLTVAKALDDYYREHVVVEVMDRARESRIIELLKQGFKGVLIKDVDIPSCRTYANLRRTGVIKAKAKNLRYKTGVVNSTIRRELTTLRAAAGHAARWKRITKAEIPPVERPKSDKKEAEWLTHDELAAVRSKATGELRDWIEMAYFTASRKGAIENMDVFQVDLARNRINLAKKGEKKTRKRRPIVPIADELRPTVERLVATATASGNTRLFSPRFRSYGRFKRLLDGMGLHDKANPHVTRHSRATHLLLDGVSIYQVAKLLGDSVEMVEQTYGHNSVEYLQDAVNRATKRA